MLQLVYISTARQPHSEQGLQSILEAARRNNTKVGVTGLLVAGGRRFLQALEGPDQAVLETYARIQADQRHFALVLLSCRTVEERAFGDWSMAYQALEAGRSAGDLKAVVAELSASLPDKSLQAQFNGFAEIHTRAA